MERILAPITDIIRPFWVPISTQFPAPIKSLGASLVTPECYTLVIENLDLVTVPACTKLTISKAIGTAIIGASSIVKVPQILSLISSKSADGVSFSSYFLETLAYIITLAYNVRQGFPFSTYGETALILVQNIVVATLILQYSGKTAGAAAFVAGFAILATALFGNTGIIDDKILGYLMSATIPLGTLSKLPAIYTVYKNGGTGQLSRFSVLNYLLGSIARVFTTLAETNDTLILTGFVLGAALNSVLAAQTVYYWNAPASKGKKPEKSYELNESVGYSSGLPTNTGARNRKA
ncbi:polyketide synthase [Ascobolus immersus RN42]|uniref:Mannose-P-dolichol utilization defect 1 protein homolog n=1 Tax=Ascobolus immersus RN42 TaxID=1160509 RepID=A0A3N4HB32_ASCIM|nr:polyketide synthase [Ascobolus immersus RN42]